MTATATVGMWASRFAAGFTRKTFMWAIWIVALTVVLVGVLPALQDPSGDKYADAIRNVQEEVATALSAKQEGSFREPKLVTTTWLVSHEVLVTAGVFCLSSSSPLSEPDCRLRSPDTSPQVSIEPRIRWDLVVLVLSGALFLTILTAYGRSTGLTAQGVTRPLEPAPVQGADQMRSPGDISEMTKLPAYREMRRDINLAMERADSLFARSNLMLLAGIIVAFLGVLLFALLTSLNELPNMEEASAETENVSTRVVNAVLSNFRPTAIFIFLETISWYLLRQYRALIEDFKSFYRIYLRRQNILSAYIIAHDRPLEQSAELAVVASLIQEDLSGHLRKGDRLDSEVQLDFASDSPTSSLAQFILGLAKKNERPKPSSQASKGG